MKKYFQEVDAAVKKLPKAKKPEAFMAKNYVGTGKSRLNFLDIKLPDLRKRLKQGFSFSELSSEEQMKIWDFIWQESNTFEVLLLPLMWIKQQKAEEKNKHKNKLISWLSKSDNWAISDSLSDFYAHFFELEPKVMLPFFKKWMFSKNPWERRQALVSLFYYSSLRKKYPSFKTAIYFIKSLMNDEHYFVQKGVGWALRETFNVYPDQTLAFLKQNASKLSSIAWIAATEKLTPSQKEFLKKLRQKK